MIYYVHISPGFTNYSGLIAEFLVQIYMEATWGKTFSVFNQLWTIWTLHWSDTTCALLGFVDKHFIPIQKNALMTKATKIFFIMFSCIYLSTRKKKHATENEVDLHVYHCYSSQRWHWNFNLFAVERIPSTDIMLKTIKADLIIVWLLCNITKHFKGWPKSVVWFSPLAGSLIPEVHNWLHFCSDWSGISLFSGPMAPEYNQLQLTYKTTSKHTAMANRALY